MRVILFLLVFLLPFAAHSQQGVIANYLRLNPTSLPTLCRVGDLRFDSSGLKLNYCNPLNTWVTVGSGGGGSGLTSLNSQTGSTQVFANDTNVIITSSNNTHSLGWSGSLSLSRGGTGASLTPVAGGSVYTTGSALAVLPAGTSGQLLISNGASAPSWGADANSANIFLSNLSVGNTAINTSLFYGTGVNGIIASASTTGTGNTNTMTVTSGSQLNAGNYNSGNTSLTTGLSSNGTSGIVTVSSGAGHINSGNVTFATGTAATGNSGNFNGTTGTANAGSSGTFNLTSGGTTTGTTGQMNIDTGNGVGSGSIQMQTGTATTNQSGPIKMITGNSSGNIAGPIVLSPGTGSGSVRGSIQFQNGTEGTAGQYWVSTDSNGSGQWQGLSGSGITSLNSQSGASQFFANDTNVIITSSNNTHSLGWASTLSISRGGTAGSDAAVLGGLVYTNASSYKVLAAGTSGQFLESQGAGAPIWATVSGGSGLTSLNSQTGSTQIFSNDTNVVITSSNNTHTLGWASTLSLARGGTGASLTAIAGGINYSTGSATAILAAGTSGQFLQSSGAGAPAWASALTSAITSLNSQTGSTQVFSNDTNVVITSSNNTHTLGWASTLSIARGGTGGASAAVLGGAVYTSGTAYQVLAAGTSGQVLASNGASAPSWGNYAKYDLSNLASTTSINSNLLWKPEIGATISTIGDSNLPGGNLILKSGDYNSPFSFGLNFIGNVIVSTGNSNIASANMGNTYITTGNATLSSSDNTTTGNTYIQTGYGNNSGQTSGNIIIAPGQGTNTNIGKIQLQPAIASVAGQSWIATDTSGSGNWANALTSLNSQTGRTQVFANDTNVVITSSNNTHSLGWSSTLSLARGGTGSAITAINGGIAWSNATNLNLLAAGTNGQVLLSGGASSPSWEGPLGLNHGGTNANLTATAGGIVYSSSSAFAILSVGTTGQVLSSNGGSAPSWINASSGSGITSLNSQTGTTQVFANDTNVVITSSNNTHTLGWASTLSIARGGTGSADTAVLGGIVYTNASAHKVLSAGTSGQILQSNGASTPSWVAGPSGIYLPLSGGTMSGVINMGSNQINNLATPSVATDAVNKSYVDNLLNGLTWKSSVKESTTTALPTNTYNNGVSGVGATLTGLTNGALTVDGVSVASNDRILVKNESTQANNGVYVVTATGGVSSVYVLTRSSDYNQSSEMAQGDAFFVNTGTVNSYTSWSLSTSGTITVGTTALTFVQIAGPGDLVSGTGISISGNTISLVTPVAISSGGTNNSSLGPVLGGIAYSDASKLNILAAGTSGQLLASGGAGAPTWTSSSSIGTPTNWTCTIRTGSSSQTSTVSCVGNEKVISGGCSSATGSQTGLLGSFPNGQGWECLYISGDGYTGVAYANCCL